MPLDSFVNPEIIMGYKSPDLSGLDPSRMMANVLAYKQAQTQQQANALALQEAKQKAADQALLQEAYNQADPVNYLRGLGRLDIANTYAGLQRKEEEDRLNLQTKQAAYRKAVSEADKTEVDNALQTVQNQFAGVIARNPNLNTEQALRDYLSVSQQAHMDPHLGPILSASGAHHANTVLQAQTALENGTLPQLIQNSAQSAENLRKGFMPMTPEEQARLEETRRANLADEATARGNLAVNQGQLKVSQTREAREADAENAVVPLSHSALVNAATMYNINGTLPSLGAGKFAAGQKSAIINMADLLNQGVDPNDAAMTRISNKANQTALAQITKQQTMTGAFERTFNANADIVLKASKEVDRTGIPLLNKWVQAGKKATSSQPELKRLDMAIKTAMDEYAKIVTNSTGSANTALGQIKAMNDKLNAANTPEEVAAVISLMKQDSANRMTGFQQQKDELLRAFTPNKTTTPPAAGGGAQTPPAAGGGKIQVRAPDGKTYTFADQKSADAFKAKAGIK